MLIVERNPGESVEITMADGRKGYVTVVEGSGRLRLGFDFPRDVAVLRDDAKVRSAPPGRAEILVRVPEDGVVLPDGRVVFHEPPCTD